jgi:hypothetical protein
MLDFVPEGQSTVDLKAISDDEIFCANCGAVLTRGRWRISRRDAHEHTVFNPAGRLFTILCFQDAPGTSWIGAPSHDFTWFPGYHWTVALCTNCGIHVGWRFRAGDIFFGLIKSCLSASK